MNSIALPTHHGVVRIDHNYMASINSVLDFPKTGFLLCLQGSISIADTNNFHDLTSRDLYIYKPNTQIYIKTWSRDFEALVAVIDIEVMMPIIAPIIDVETGMTVLANPCVSLSAQQVSGIIELTDAYMRREPLTDSQIKTELMNSLASSICYELALAYKENIKKEPQPSTRADQIFIKFLFSIKENISSHHEVAFYAGKQNLSPKYFSLIIKSVTGIYAGEWIRIVILSIAKNMLKHSKTSIKEIAYSLGFPSQANFGRFFKHNTGISPGQFRNRSLH
mgnify:FL=1